MNASDYGDDFFSQAEQTADLLAGLNPQQRRAAEILDGPLMILAGPGSGKTRVITHRVANMIHNGIRADQIVALTFTNKAAEELKNRIATLVPGSYVWAGTFHRFCSRLLRQYAPLVGLSENFSILDMDDVSRLLANAWAVADIADEFVSRNAVQSEISRAKNAIVTAEEYQGRAGNAVGKVTQQVYPIYQRMLLECNSVDFDDLLMWTAIILQQNEELRQSLDQRFAYIMVDEYQDTNLAQYAIVRSLSNDLPNLAITGDPDQSIYGWRGASIQNILGFEQDYPAVEVVRLEQNYRSTKAILSIADHLISNNKQRKAKKLISDSDQGDPVRSMVFPSPQEEADFIARDVSQLIADGIWEPKDIAIFYRANWLSRNLEHAFNGLGIPFQLVNGFEFYQRKEVKDLIAYLRLLNNPRNDLALERVINSPSRKIGKVTLDRLKASASGKRISLLEACRICGLDGSLPARSATSVARFVSEIDRLSELQTNSIQEYLQSVLQVTHYRAVLVAEDTEQAIERIANVDELISAAREFDNQHPEDGGLQAYLETAALVSDTDKLVDGDLSLKMMTMHAAKGLEFPCVYIVGLEEGILPHERSRESAAQIEEERRLFFVGITRAERQLTLCRCEGRMKRGQFWVSPPSSFLMELPSDELDIYDRKRGSKQIADSYNNDFSVGEDWIDSECGGATISIDDHSSLSKPSPKSSSFDVQALDATDVELDENQRDRSPKNFAKPTVPKPKGKLGSIVPKITTAAAMFGIGSKKGPAGAGDGSSEFRSGMMVEHPEYGPGKITSLSGAGAKEMATVQFYSVGEKKFRVKFSTLKPLG